MSSIIKFVVCIGENAAFISVGGGDSIPSPVTNAAGARGEPIITPTPLSVSNMRVLGVSSGGSHAAAHISPFESYVTSPASTPGRWIDVGGVAAGGGGGGGVSRRKRKRKR